MAPNVFSILTVFSYTYIHTHARARAFVRSHALSRKLKTIFIPLSLL